MRLLLTPRILHGGPDDRPVVKVDPAAICPQRGAVRIAEKEERARLDATLLADRPAALGPPGDGSAGY